MNIDKVNYLTRLSYRDLENYAGNNYQIVYKYIKDSCPDVNPNSLLIGAIFTSIASDGKFSDSEWNFVKYFIGGYTYEQAFDTISEFQAYEAKKTTREVLKALPYSAREALYNVIYAVICVDGRVNGIEEEFLDSLIVR